MNFAIYNKLVKICMSSPLSTLEECELLVEFDRLDNCQYFTSDFSCPALQAFFKKVTSMEAITQNKQILNHYFDRLLDVSNFQKSLYSRLKWLLVLHLFMKNLQENQKIIGFIHKALELYLFYLREIQEAFPAYQKYLTKILFRPYIQYITKYCQLIMHEEEDPNQAQQEASIKLGCITGTKPDKWYKEYNFLIWSLQVFDKPTKEVYSFFADSFPFLNQIGVSIAKDLKARLVELKRNYLRMSGLREMITVLEFSRVEQKVNEFEENHCNFLDDFQEVVPSLKKEMISEFLASPLKPVKNSFMALTSCSITQHAF